MRKSWTGTCSGAPLGRNSRPPFLNGPTNSLPLFGVDRDAWFTRPELLLDRPIQVLKLSVAVRMLAPLQRLLIRLQVVAHGVEQLSHHAMAGLVALRVELFG